MKLGHLKKTIYLSQLCLLLTSCGELLDLDSDKQELLGNPNSYTFLEPIRASKTLTEGEMVVAKRICDSLKQKRELLAVQGRPLTLNLSVKSKDCSSQAEEEQRGQATINYTRNGDLSLSVSDRNLPVENDVLSDKHPRLESICNSVIAGSSPQNTISDGDLRYQISFYQTTTYEWIQIAEFTNVDNRFMPYLIERSAIITSYSRETGGVGYARSRTFNRPCQGSLQTQYVIQEIL